MEPLPYGPPHPSRPHPTTTPSSVDPSRQYGAAEHVPVAAQSFVPLHPQVQLDAVQTSPNQHIVQPRKDFEVANGLLLRQMNSDSSNPPSSQP